MMANIKLTESEHYQTIVINANSALKKSDYYFELSRFVRGKITESTFKTVAETFLKAAGENNPNAAISGAATIVGVINDFVPSMEDKVVKNCEHSSKMFDELKESIQDSAFPKWEVKLMVKRYKTNDGSYLDIPVGRTITGYYTSTGQKATI